MPELPTGTVTFLFTDVEGSTRLWEESPEPMRQALVRHDQLVEQHVAEHSGAVVRPRGEGDSRFAVFARASDAVAAAVAMQVALHAEPWPTPEPVRVRMALHTGEADLREGDYYGAAVNRCARLRAIAHGGQVVASQITYELARDALPNGTSLRDAGQHRLADLIRPERVFQLVRADLPANFPPLRSLDSYPHNLPVQLTTFIGREEELADLGGALTKTRLLTLTGTGGCGKTRLALQLGADQLDRYPEGVWVVELAPLSDAALIVQAVATVVGVREEPGQALLATLLAALRARRLLLVLDNCEHLLDGCARLADAVLRECPRIQILATSRAALGIGGEVVRRVPSLALPPSDPAATVEQLTRYGAVRLFVERALAVQPSFAVTNQHAAAVALICSRLDGIPLAIELAAARTRVLTVEQIAERLGDRFRLLTGGSRTALPRQQTLRALVDWSYDLLSEPEQQLLRRLAVFAGEWPLEAAEAVGSGDGIEAFEVLDLLTQLVDKSLVLATEQAGRQRYRLLETIRQYAGEKLRESGEEDAVRARHRAWYRALVERAAPELGGPYELGGPAQRAWLDRLEGERDNLRAVLERSLANATELEEGLRLVAALLRLWIVRGYLGEGRHLLTTLLGSPVGTPAMGRTIARAAALYSASLVAYFQGDFTAAGSLAEESLGLARDLGDERAIWFATDQIAAVFMNQGDYPRAAALFLDLLATMRRLGDRTGISYALLENGILARLQGDTQRAVAWCEESLRLSREVGDFWLMGQVLSNLGLAHYQLGHYGKAREQFAEALVLRRELRDQPGIAWSLINLGDVEHAQGDDATARARFEESLALLRELGDRSGSADALTSLGRIAVLQGDLRAARKHYAASLVMRRECKQWFALSALLEDIAGLAAAKGRPDRALTLSAAAETLRSDFGAQRSTAEEERVAQWWDGTRAAVDDAAFTVAWAKGQAMTLEHAIEYALQEDADG